MSDKEISDKEYIVNQVKKVYQYFDMDFKEFKKEIIITENDESFEDRYYTLDENAITIIAYDQVKNNEKYRNLSKKMYYRNILIDLFKDIFDSFSNVKLDEKHVHCFYYGIANYFLEQSKKYFITHIITKEDIYKEYADNISYMYDCAIGDYIMSNYSKDKVYEYLKDPRLLKEDEEKIIDEFNEYNANEKNNYPVKEKVNNISIYSKEEISSINETKKVIKDNNRMLYEFFEIKDNNLPELTIVLHNKEEFLKVVSEHLKEYKTWLCGFAMYNTVHVLKYDDYTNTDSSKGISLSDYNEMLLHEIVHLYHISIMIKRAYKDSWFSEALACNLGNPSKYRIVDVTKNISCDDIYDKRVHYGFYFTLGKYILEKYSKEKIMKCCKYGDEAVKILPEILDDIKNEKAKISVQ